MRSKPLSSLILVYLQVHLGKWVSQKRIGEVADDCVDPARILRQLRADGWPLEVDGKGNWRLRKEERGEPRGVSRSVPASMRVMILERDGGRCKLCGIAAGEINLDGRPTRLEVDHVIPWHHGGRTEPDNLRVLCHLDNHDKRDMIR